MGGGAGRAIAVRLVGRGKVIMPAEQEDRRDGGATESQSVRLFVAIQLPESVRAELRMVQGELKQLLPRGSAVWTRPENQHLTLRFLGNVESAQLPELSQRLRTALAGFGALDVTCERLGCFPHSRFPRVIWAWVHDGNDRLAILHQRINEAVADFAETPAERQFTGHVTLGRPKQIRRPEAEKLDHFLEASVGRNFGGWRVRDVELIRSELSPHGSRYTTLDVFPL